MARAPGNELHFALSRPVEGTEASLAPCSLAHSFHWRLLSPVCCWRSQGGALVSVKRSLCRPSCLCGFAGASSWFARQQPERRLLEYVNKYTRTHRLSRTRCPFTGPMALIGHIPHTSVERERPSEGQKTCLAALRFGFNFQQLSTSEWSAMFPRAPCKRPSHPRTSLVM